MDLAEHVPWVRRLARRFHPNDRDDCEQAGLLALLRCTQRFDPTLGVKLETYARKAVVGVMLDLVKERRPVVEAPMLVAKPELDDARELVESKLGSMKPRVATTMRMLLDGHRPADVARALGVTEQRAGQLRRQGMIALGVDWRAPAPTRTHRRRRKERVACAHCKRQFHPLRQGTRMGCCTGRCAMLMYWSERRKRA